MANSRDMGNPQQGMSEQQYLAQLKSTFMQMPNDIPLYMFVQKGKEDMFVQANRQIVRAFRELTNKIVFKEFNLDHELAKKWNVTHSPTLLVAPERFSIRWLGAPLGEEGRTFLETLLLVGMNQSHLNEEARKVL
ncbi:MAG: pyridine nucleotide-disulfide oxidoreductase, partial [Thermodesulfobacteriota bacterium]